MWEPLGSGGAPLRFVLSATNMKNYLNGLLLLCVIAIPSFANAKSLDDVANAQTTEEISPVSLNGAHFSKGQAAKVCAAMGFVRVIASSSEPCDAGEKLMRFQIDLDDRAFYPPVPASDFAICVQPSIGRLKSVTCAK